MERILIAFGGNALLRNGDDGTFASQQRRANEAFQKILDVILENDVVITHGNGPQVGNLLLQNENSSDIARPMPLHACGAMSQGLIGEILLGAYDHVKVQKGIVKDAVVIVTRTLVDPKDPAFNAPSKPIGPYYTKDESERYAKEQGWIMREENGKGYRRAVPSPVPIDIVERASIFDFLNDGFMPICAGGGGIPVVKRENSFVGIDAVIDKDLASSLLASILEVDKFVILTDVDNVYMKYGEPSQERIERIRYTDLETMYKKGFFPKGNMGPKVTAAFDFVKRSGKKALIGSLDDAGKVVREESGTIVY